MERINARSPKKKSRLINYARKVFADLLRDREPKAPKWVKDLINAYSWTKQGILPDNRGLDYNNLWLLEAFEAFNEEEARWMREQMPDEGGKLRRAPITDLSKLKEAAVKSAQQLISSVVEQMLDGKQNRD